MSDELFRFVALRSAESVDYKNKAITIIERETTSAFLNDLRQIRGNSNENSLLFSRAQNFIGSGDYVTDLALLETPLATLDAWLNDHDQSNIAELSGAIRNIFGIQEIDSIVEGQNYKISRRKLSESIVASTLSPTGQNQSRLAQIKGLRLCNLLEELATLDATITNEKDWIKSVMEKTIALPGDIFPIQIPQLTSDSGESVERRRLTTSTIESAATVKTKISELKGASTELLRISACRFDVVDQIPRPSIPATDVTSPRVPDRIPRTPDLMRMPWLIPTDLVTNLNIRTKDILTQGGFKLDSVNLVDAMKFVESQIAEHAAKLPREDKSTIVYADGNIVAALDMSWRNDATTRAGTAPTIPSSRGAAKVLGFADLMVVRETIQKYEMGEIAHVENILERESKKRTHRRSRKTEESFFSETETTEESEKDLQTTERYTLQTEASEVTKIDGKLEAGVKTTARYGTVTVEAHMDIAVSGSKETSDRMASNYAREVTERATNRLQQRVREQRTRQVTEEFEEINEHGFDNSSGTENVVGIYRWLDKIYEAEVVNYGNRLMLEFVIPEPAAFLLYSMANTPTSSGTVLERPDPFILMPTDIDITNYSRLGAKYRAAGVTPPPELFKTLAHTYSFTSDGNEHHESKEHILEIPAGYEALQAYVAITWSDVAANRTLDRCMLAIGGHRIPVDFDVISAFQDRRYLKATQRLDCQTGKIPVVISTQHKLAFSVAIEILCSRTSRTFEEWQIKTHNSIMQGYLNLKSEYEERLAAAAVRNGVSIEGANPAQNREVEKTELKRSVLSMLTGQHFEDFDAMREVSEEGYPQMDFTDAHAEGDYVLIFEQAFEWQQMTYVFYPYFWADKKRWISLLKIRDDSDPIHAKFLQAGYARVVVPVRPGFEPAILHYLQSPAGEIWGGLDGSDSLDVTNPMYVPIIEELKESKGGGPQGQRVGETWIVKVPTTLVLLQENADLPDWTGGNV